ncbi:MAG: 3-dioxygenase [Candidatus Ordinivivax streblomastigis]|uniref:3-dioxygenase n=1 Tax=Candidatus Ordinivivax streblomastigis TaxID=2540710 RepID=A0A5M8P5G0_9BACT|nr:MAG: 3-dioxygenase [Candidatus Ordinivivax streblomastigis]
MKTVLYKANTRGNKNYGWLDTHHTFSFADYHNPERIHFGALRVLNDDIVIAGEGFGTHPHNNMEIISIPLYGDLQHQDSMGNGSVIRSGEVQVMSAGTGITHSEFNANAKEDLNFFQIWIIPNQKEVTPRYGQQQFDFVNTRNQLIQIVSPSPDDAGLWIYQDAWFNIGSFDPNYSFNYPLKKEGNGLYIMVIEGDFEVEGQALSRRDGMGVWDTDSVQITACSKEARVLLMEVPM